MIRAIAPFLLMGSAAVAETAVGALRITGPALRETPPNAPVAAGFLTVTNTGGEDDRLLAATMDPGTVREIQLHEMAMTDGVMRMAPVEGGIDVPAGETVHLEPGGLHLMLMGLAAPMAAGDTHSVTLRFAEAGEVTLSFPVRTLAEIRDGSAPAHGMGGHDEAADTEGK